MAGTGIDRLDVQILRELTQSQGRLPARPGLRSSYRQIASRLSVSPGTVRNRLRALTASGVLRGFSVYANPNLLGLRAAAYSVEVPASLPKPDVVERIAELPGVFFVQNFRGGLVGVAFVYESEATLSARLRRIRTLAHAPGGQFSRVPYPPCSATLTRGEWTLVAELARGGFRSYQELAGALQSSVRTVKRRLARLVHAGAILSVPTMDYRAIVGAVPTDFLVTFTSPAARPAAEERILQILADRMIYAGAWTELGMYSLLLPNLAAAETLARQVAAIEGVRAVRPELVEEHIDRVQGLLPYLERVQGALTALAPLPVPA